MRIMIILLIIFFALLLDASLRTAHWEQSFSLTHCTNSSWYTVYSDADSITVGCDPVEDSYERSTK